MEEPKESSTYPNDLVLDVLSNYVRADKTFRTNRIQIVRSANEERVP